MRRVIVDLNEIVKRNWNDVKIFARNIIQVC